MPKVKSLGKTDYGLILQGELRASRERLLMDRKTVAEKTDCCYGTVKNHEKQPHKIPLGWLKKFVKLTNMNPNVILYYLYEGKYEAKEKEK